MGLCLKRSLLCLKSLSWQKVIMQTSNIWGFDSTFHILDQISNKGIHFQWPELIPIKMSGFTEILYKISVYLNFLNQNIVCLQVLITWVKKPSENWEGQPKNTIA